MLHFFIKKIGWLLLLSGAPLVAPFAVGAPFHSEPIFLLEQTGNGGVKGFSYILPAALRHVFTLPTLTIGSIVSIQVVPNHGLGVHVAPIFFALDDNHSLWRIQKGLAAPVYLKNIEVHAMTVDDPHNLLIVDEKGSIHRLDVITFDINLVLPAGLLTSGRAINQLPSSVKTIEKISPTRVAMITEMGELFVVDLSSKRVLGEHSMAATGYEANAMMATEEGAWISIYGSNPAAPPFTLAWVSFSWDAAKNTCVFAQSSGLPLKSQLKMLDIDRSTGYLSGLSDNIVRTFSVSSASNYAPVILKEDSTLFDPSFLHLANCVYFTATDLDNIHVAASRNGHTWRGINLHTPNLSPTISHVPIPTVRMGPHPVHTVPSTGSQFTLTPNPIVPARPLPTSTNSSPSSMASATSTKAKEPPPPWGGKRKHAKPTTALEFLELAAYELETLTNVASANGKVSYAQLKILTLNFSSNWWGEARKKPNAFNAYTGLSVDEKGYLVVQSGLEQTEISIPELCRDIAFEMGCGPQVAAGTANP